MKHLFRSLILILLTLSMLLSSCAKEEKKEVDENETSAQVTETALKEEETIKSTVEQEDPALDDEFNVIIIGNSFSTGWPDELKGLFSAAGKQLNIYTVYYSGCSLQQHWEWLQSGEGHYRFGQHVNDSGRRVDKKDASLVQCLAEKNWDVISIQEAIGPSVSGDCNAILEQCETYAKNMVDYLKWNHPASKIVWHQTWAFEVGYNKETGSVPDKETRDLHHQNIKAASQKIAKDNGIALVPCGDAWHYARQSSEVVNLTRDYYHDGPEGGGQYLNACVWFECLTGESCLGNTWRPAYSYDEYKTLALQEAAHRACEENTIK